MRSSLLAVLGVAVSPFALAQFDPYTITVTASRSIHVQPDQVRLTVDVISNLNASLDQVLAAIQNTGIISTDLVGVSTVGNAGIQFNGDVPGNVDWSFTTAVPLTALKTTTDSLSTTAKSLASGNSGMTLAFSVQGAATSPQALAAQPCKTSDLMADARGQALKFANAAGFGLGAILAVSDSSVTNPFPAAAYRIGIDRNASLIFDVISSQPPPLACAISVKFRLLQS